MATRKPDKTITPGISAYKVLVALQGPPHRRVAKAGLVRIGGRDREDTRLNCVTVNGNYTGDEGMVSYALSSLSESVKDFGLEEQEWG